MSNFGSIFAIRPKWLHQFLIVHISLVCNYLGLPSYPALSTPYKDFSRTKFHEFQALARICVNHALCCYTVTDTFWILHLNNKRALTDVSLQIITVWCLVIKDDKTLSYTQKKLRIQHGSIVWCKMHFNMKPAWITSVTVQRRHLSNVYKTPSWKPWKLQRFRQLATVFNTLVWCEPLNSGPRNLASKN